MKKILFNFKESFKEAERRERANYGLFYINATKRQLDRDVREYLDMCSKDRYNYDFWCFIDYLKTKYQVEKAKEINIKEVIY